MKAWKRTGQGEWRVGRGGVGRVFRDGIGRIHPVWRERSKSRKNPKFVA